MADAGEARVEQELGVLGEPGARERHVLLAGDEDAAGDRVHAGEVDGAVQEARHEDFHVGAGELGKKRSWFGRGRQCGRLGGFVLDEDAAIGDGIAFAGDE